MAVYPERRTGRLSGKWIAEVTHNGERRRKRFDLKVEAERWADFTKVTGAPPPDANNVPALAHPFGEVVQEALKKHPGWEGDRDCSREQRLDYAVDLIGREKPIADVSTADLDKLVADLKKRPGIGGKRLSPGTINRYLSLVSAVITYARKHQYRESAPAVPWQKEAGRRIHWLTEVNEQALGVVMLKKGWSDDEIVLRVLTATGLRWGEFETLEKDQVTERWIKLDKTKTDTPRDVPIAPELARELLALIERKSPVFKYDTFREHLKSALKSAGQNTALSIHCLRHTTATRLVLAGVNLAVVQKFMGHSSINTTLKYTHVTEGALQDALQKISPRAGQSENSPKNDTQETPENPALPKCVAG